MPWEFVDAEVGRQDAPEYDDATCQRYFGRSLKPGEIGCFLSHRKVWQMCLALDKPILVLEDDINVRGCLNSALSFAATSHLKWDVLRLAGIYAVRRQIIHERHDDSKLVELLENPCGTAAYWLTPSGAQKLLAHSSTFFMPVDHYLEERYMHGAEILACQPYPLAGDAFDPATSSTIGPRNQTRPNLLRKIRQELFRAPYGFRRRMWQWMRLWRITRFPSKVSGLSEIGHSV